MPPMDSEPKRRKETLPMPQVGDHLPPHSIEAEQIVLGSILLNPVTALPIAVERIKTSDVFYDLRHQALYDAIVEMNEAKKPIEVMALFQYLKDKNQAEALGGMPYIAGLMNVGGPMMEYYLEIVFEKYQLRSIISVCTRAISKVYEDQTQVRNLADEIGRDVIIACEPNTAKKRKTIRNLVHGAIDTIEQIHNRKGLPIGIPSGFPDLDKMTCGFRNSELIIIAARPSLGKTSLAMNIADHVSIVEGIPVGVFSLEMTAEALTLRMLCSRSRVNWKHVQDGFLADVDYPRLTEAAGKLANAFLEIDATDGLNILQLKAKARRMYHENGVRLFVVDYLQVVQHVGRVENRAQQIGQVAQGLKDLAKELDVPVIVLAQLNRELDKEKKRRKPRLSDLKESGDIEQIADLVGMLYKPTDTEDEEESPQDASACSINLLIAKQRNGPTGDVCLTFLKGYTRFESISKVAEVETGLGI